ncbi:hemerythrin domain-containing protein [Microbacterium sp. gxy059]|uniref:hemerythrin domain-containing protein n=1 Tax=Microbacterium sp. gxy059 TaxID=2957199 RepID=UPI003D9604ED
MSEGETTRLIAWARELTAVHARLRRAIRVAEDAAGDGAAQRASRDLLLFCHGFCAALSAHHVGEDRTLFPAIAAAHPELGETIRLLEQDHSMIGHLLDGLRSAVDEGGSPERLRVHLEGIGAIMESHFRYEERALGQVLETLELDRPPGEVFGPL